MSDITTKTVFYYGTVDTKEYKGEYNAWAWYPNNCIEIGSKTLTIETLTHELSELTVLDLLYELGIKDPQLHNKLQLPQLSTNHRKKTVSHLLSPYGQYSLLYPCNNDFSDNSNEEQLCIS